MASDQAALPAITPARAALLQRKCACGGSPALSGECEECRNKRLTLQRRTTNPAEPFTVPPLVHEVLRSPGQPLDPATRAFMEPRFGHDFSRVRLHTDAQAVESARAVHALAYTVGHDVVFGAGQHVPGTTQGKRLLAHELAHVAQQSSGGSQVGIQRLAHGEDRYEREAEAIAAQVAKDAPPERIRPPVSPIGRASPAVMRVPDEGKPGAEKKTREPVNHAKQPLSPEERQKIKQVTGAMAPATVSTFSDGPRFVLHDTGSRVELNAAERKKVDADFLKAWQLAHKKEPKEEEGKKALEEQKKAELERAMTQARQAKERTTYEGHERNERGPLDEAAAAWVPEAGAAVVARPQFFDPRRPAATQFERRADIIAMEPRERAFEKVWQATSPAEQQAALQASLAGLEVTPNKGESKAELTQRAIKERKITPDEVAAEQKKANEQLASPLPAKFGAAEKPHYWTTAAWSVERVCEHLKTAKAEELAASKDKAKDLEAGCKALEKYFAQRGARFGSTVNVEVSQPAGSACNSDEKKFTLVPLPPYTASQYQAAAQVYLQAALQADQFPEVTTHFWLDNFDASGHCDPRCFNLQAFYDAVAGMVGHAKGSLYGIKPNYGTTRGTHNVWWHPKVCGGNHP
jgi:hypothetical protein